MVMRDSNPFVQQIDLYKINSSTIPMEQRVNNIFVETIVADQIHTISQTDQLYLPMKVIVERTEYTYPEFSAKYEPHVFPETQ